jgi:hypothetical protein
MTACKRCSETRDVSMIKKSIVFWSLLLTMTSSKVVFSDQPVNPKNPNSHQVRTAPPGTKQPEPHFSRRKPYRVIYQQDSSWGLANAVDVEDYLHGMCGFLKDTHVDALFWHDGAGGNTANYDSDVLELTGERIGKVHPFLEQLIRTGNDPAKIVVQEAHRYGVDIFYSFRINDLHDSLGDGKSHPQLIASFKVEHPDWTIGRDQPYGGVHQLDFAIPEVRELKFSVIEEVFRKYNFDGLEIDFMRSPPHFIPGTEPENAPILTQFLRRVREHLVQRAKERGKPIPLAVRVSETREACRLDGFDVKTWIQERLVDILILGSGAIDIEVESFKQLAANTNILIYPCLYGWPSGYMPISPEMTRGLAVNYWHQGADGIYTFNWNAHTYTQRPSDRRPGGHAKFKHQIQRLREIDSPDVMRGTDKVFAADRGRPGWTYPHNWIHCVLPVTFQAGQNRDISVLVGEDLTRPPQPQHLHLAIDCAQKQLPGVDPGTWQEFSDDDQFEIKLNGKKLSNLKRVDSRTVIPLNSEQLLVGRNRVNISASAGEFTVNAVEIQVTYD